MKSDVERLIKKELEIQVELKEIHSIGERTLLVKLKNHQDKSNILKNKHKLRKIANGKIYIDEDMTKKEREKARQIRKIAKEESDKGNKVKIGYNRVVIEGEEWRWNYVKERLERMNPKN